MQKAEAVILAVDDSRRQATVSVDRQQVCARCAAGRGCGAGVFASAKSAVELDIDLPVNVNAAPGDRFELELAPSDLLHAAWLVYGLPLAGLVTAVGVMRLFAGPVADSTAVLVAVGGLAAGFLAGRFRLRQARCFRQFVPKLAGRVEPT